MAINFPSNPTAGQRYQFGDYLYVFDGIKWMSSHRTALNIYNSLAEMKANVNLKDGDWAKVLHPLSEYVIGTTAVSPSEPLANGLFANGVAEDPTRGVAIIVDKQQSYSGGGTNVADAMTSRKFTEITEDTIGISANMSTGMVTIPAGEYFLRGTASFGSTGITAVALYNDTTSSYIAAGESGNLASGGSLEAMGYIKSTSPTNVSLHYIASSVEANTGLGVSLGSLPGVPTFMTDTTYASLIISQILTSK